MATEQIPITRDVLKWAINRSGYSLEDLRGSFKKIDDWVAQDGGFPSYPQLEKLSEKFKVPIAVFFFPEPPNVPLVEQSFRTLGVEHFAMIPPRVRLLLGKAQAFQTSLAELTRGRNPSDRLITRDLKFKASISIDKMASAVRDYFGISIEEQCSWKDADTALKNWREVVHSAGVYVFKDRFRQDDYSGFCLYDDEYPIIYVNNTNAKTRQAFTIFHELAHLLFETSGVDKLDDDYIDMLPKDEKRIEVICNRFAARFLMPEAAFEKAFNGLSPTEETADLLASQFHVSRELIFRKFLDKELVSEQEYLAASKRWAKQKKKGSGGDPYRSKMAYLGKEYVNLAFSQFYQNRIDEYQLADYLDMKPKHVLTLENYLSGAA